MTIRRILHATDFSRASRGALRLAQDLARALRAELILCHAWERLLPFAGGPLPEALPASTIREMWATQRQEAERQLARLAKPVRGGRLRVTTLLVEGPPARAIVRAARARRAGLLVLGTHGRRGVPRMLMGSVAERVVRTAPCPVLTVGPGRRR